MTLTDAIDEVTDVLESHGLALPTAALREIVARLRPDLIVIEAPVVMVEIAPGVFGRDAAPMPPPTTESNTSWPDGLSGLARHEGGDA